MTNSRQIARILGPAMVALGVSEAMNLAALAGNPPQVVYLNGTVLLVAGVAIVQAHNRWMQDWRVLVTLIGWALVIGGLYRMFAPTAPQLGPGPGAYILLATILLIGVLLSYQAYRPLRGDTP